MGASYGDFTKYPRTPHLFGSVGTDDDKHLAEAASSHFIADDSLIIEEKVDGTNTGIHFEQDMILQCRGHLITEGMHPQYDLFKQWAITKRWMLEAVLENRYIMFGEWVYAKHSVQYFGLSHYFLEFDIYDKQNKYFLCLDHRLELIDLMGVQTVPVVHKGSISYEDLVRLIGPSQFDARFENPITGKVDNLMEGVYLRTEADGVVTGRAKFVRPEFVEKIKQSTHWQHQAMIPNKVADGVDIWA